MSSFDLIPKLFLTNGTIATTGTSANLNAGDLGLFDVYTHQVVTVANAASHGAAYIAQGSYYPNDKIGSHGGFKESVKSPAPTKGINPKAVKRFYKDLPRPAVTQSVRMFWNGSPTAVGPQFFCGTNYTLRLEVKGEPVLRMINRDLYKHLVAYTGCCGNDCSTACTSVPVDGATVLAQFAATVNKDPLLSKFLSGRAIVKVASPVLTIALGATSGTVDSATGIAVGQRIIGAGIVYGTTVISVSGSNVTISVATTAAVATAVSFCAVVDANYVSPATDALKAAVVAGLEVDVNYVETVFMDQSFNQADYYNQRFIEVLGSMVYQNTVSCSGTDVVMNHSTGAGWTEVVPFKTPQGSGEIILREFIASQTGNGIFFSHIPRDRETTGNIALTAVDRTASYVRYGLIYSVQQTGNPSNTLSHDQYLISFAIKSGVSLVAFETVMLAWLNAFNPNLVLEVI